MYQVKERERADAEEEARHMEQLEEVKRRSEAEAKEAEEARRVVEQAAAQEVLPDEPAEDNPNPQANIRFRTPTETLNRRFLANQTLNTLLLYLASKGYRPADYKILSSWPRRDISVLSSESSLQELKLCPQETLTLEARHAQDSDSD
ncbi:FAS-associated factor 1 [Eurytemora carolleeae]|uniref:FAS-associated factor 1 n=1 Tax=Eurytemora carolleeae TaxID=1294199 RepID=UPI000C76B530|nr:FAS-associated factor 1 [Eurytemora carolleeae]|eukprot:XP_023321564.1 FAS-associated factor 1-like [Eurytemora affinis]